MSFANYIDDLIIVQAHRFQAVSDELDLDRSQQDAWTNVARAVRDAICHPITAEERLAVLHIDCESFTGEVCRQRCQYQLWRRRERTKVPIDHPNGKSQPSNFNVKLHSLRQCIEDIYTNARNNLPSIPDDEELSAGHEDCVVFSHAMKSEDQVREDAAMAAAEDEYLSRVQQLQKDYFNKTRRWLDAPPLPQALPQQTIPQKTLPTVHTDPAKLETASAFDEIKRNLNPFSRPPRPSVLAQASTADVDACEAYYTEGVPEVQGARSDVPVRPGRWDIQEYSDDEED